MIADDMLFGERRQHTRKKCLRLVSISDHSKLYSGHLRDLGVGGAYLEHKEEDSTNIGQELILSIPYGLRTGFVNLRAKVAWVKHRGFGVCFLSHRDSHYSQL